MILIMLEFYWIVYRWSSKHHINVNFFHFHANKKIKIFYSFDNSGLWNFSSRESSHQKEIIIIALFHIVKSRISEKGKPQFDTALIQCIKRGSKKIKCRSRAQWDQNLYELAFEFLFHFIQGLNNVSKSQ